MHENNHGILYAKPSGSIAFTTPEKTKTRPVITLVAVLNIFISDQLSFIDDLNIRLKIAAGGSIVPFPSLQLATTRRSSNSELSCNIPYFFLKCQAVFMYIPGAIQIISVIPGPGFC